MPLSTCLHLGVKRHQSMYAYIWVSKIILYICSHQRFQRAAIYMPTLGFPNIYSIFAYTQISKDAPLCVPILWSLKMLLYDASTQISKNAPLYLYGYIGP